MKDIRKTAGTLAEENAAAFLQERGVRILQKNYRCRYGEIDLIGWDGEYFLIIEVKYRSNIHQGEPAEAVGFLKQRKICLTFDHYRMKKQMDDFVPVRFDVIEIDGRSHCNWIKHAFEYISD